MFLLKSLFNGSSLQGLFLILWSNVPIILYYQVKQDLSGYIKVVVNVFLGIGSSYSSILRSFNLDPLRNEFARAVQIWRRQKGHSALSYTIQSRYSSAQYHSSFWVFVPITSVSCPIILMLQIWMHLYRRVWTLLMLQLYWSVTLQAYLSLWLPLSYMMKLGMLVLA